MHPQHGNRLPGCAVVEQAFAIFAANVSGNGAFCQIGQFLRCQQCIIDETEIPPERKSFTQDPAAKFVFLLFSIEQRECQVCIHFLFGGPCSVEAS